MIKEVFHGTGMRTLSVIDNGEDLYGMYFPRRQKSSASLTNTLSFAMVYALRAEEVGRGDGIVLTYTMPENLLIPDGSRLGSVVYYYMKDWVDPENVARGYLSLMGITIEEAKRQVVKGDVMFYRIPTSYFQSSVSVKDIIKAGSIE